MPITDKPYIIRVAEIIYSNISEIKKNNLKISSVEAIERFVGTKIYKQISSGEFHELWLNDLKNNNLVDKESGKKIPNETIKLLQIQKDTILEQLKVPALYYAKSSYPIETPKNIFNLLWRMCQSYELWCKETKQNNCLILKITN